MSKRALDLLQPKFPGHMILGLSEDGKNVALISNSDGAAFTYSFRDEDNGEVVPSRIMPVVLAASYKFGEQTMDIPVEQITDHLSARIMTLTADLATAEAGKKGAEDALSAMKIAEDARRLAAVEAAVDAKNSSLKDLYGEEVVSTFAADVKKDAKLYASLEVEGKFIGDGEAVKAFSALCMGKKAELDEKAKAATKTTYAWESIGADPAKHNGLEAALAAINGQ